MSCLEFWCFESLVFMSGYLGVNELGTSVIMLDTINVIFGITIGISFPTATYVGNNIGAMKPGNALTYAK